MTATSEALAERLTATQTLAADQLAAARRHAEKENCSLDQALVALRFMDYTELGWCVSDLLRLPYRRLVSQRPSEQVRGAISPRAAAAFGVFPVDYDLRHGLLTLAVDDENAMRRLERIRRLLLQPYDLAFTAASRAEIEKAFECHFGILMSNVTHKQVLPGLRAPAEPAVCAAAAPAAPPAAAPPSPAETGATLEAVAALAAALHLQDDAERLRCVRQRARHSRLLAARLNIPAAQADELALAAWLTALEDRPELLRSLPALQPAQRILFPAAPFPDQQEPAARILSLVRAYEDVQRREPAAARDVTLARRRLRAEWAAGEADEKVLECFLQILIDEEFLAELEQKAARVLVVTADPETARALSDPLAQEGCAVAQARTVSAALAALVKNPVDVIIADRRLPDEDALQFCRRVKRSVRTARAAVVFVAGFQEQARAAECLRAGADDVLMLPVDPALLTLKVQRLAAAPERRGGREGVSGSLSDMTFSDMIQILSAGAKSMEINVFHEGEEGRVFLKEGEIVHAAVGDLQGEEAFYRMMRWKTGEFTTRQCLEFPERTLFAPVMSLLMEGARQADESADGATS